jgi:formylmethanofuran dehydrogenase subunit E-like metal-binding protein
LSISFCLPVKNGWQLAQISTANEPRVEKVSYTWPQAQWMVEGR